MSRANSALGGAFSVRSRLVGVVARAQSRRLAAIWLHTRCRCSTAYALVPSREHCARCSLSKAGGAVWGPLPCFANLPRSALTRVCLTHSCIVSLQTGCSHVLDAAASCRRRGCVHRAALAGTVCYSPKDTERALTPRALTRTYCRRHNASRRSSTARSLKLKHRHGLERPLLLCLARQRAFSLCLHHGHGPAHLEGRKISTAKSLL